MQVLYLSGSVAIEKYIAVDADGDANTYYTLGRAHREDSELAAFTGDRFDESVKGNVRRVAASADGHWLLVESDDYDWKTAKPIVRFTAVALPSGQTHSAADTAALCELVGIDAGSAKFDPAELFFDRSVILRFHNPLEPDN